MAYERDGAATGETTLRPARDTTGTMFEVYEFALLVTDRMGASSAARRSPERRRDCASF
ncbi:MAG TPA: hypothetical protein VGH11_01225 [Jatrophihabitans sp.]|jgi:hypothetical protein